jgi:hypothetical protein
MADLYKHSGAVTVTGTLLGLVCGGVAAVALAFVYTYAIVWIPLIYVNFLLTVCFTAGIGFAVAIGAKAGKLRNMAVAGLLGAFCGLVGLYTAWAIHPMAQFDQQPIFHPATLFGYMGAVYEHGTWGIVKGSTVNGIFLGIIWAVEAGIVVLGAALIPPGRLSDLAFCEPCDVWTRLEKGLRTLSLENVDPILARVAEGDVAALRETKRHKAVDPGHVRVDLSSCPNCANSAYLTLTLVQKKTDDKGKESLEEKAVLQNLVLSAADVGIVKEPAAPA